MAEGEEEGRLATGDSCCHVCVLYLFYLPLLLLLVGSSCLEGLSADTEGSVERGNKGAGAALPFSNCLSGLCWLCVYRDID